MATHTWGYRVLGEVQLYSDYQMIETLLPRGGREDNEAPEVNKASLTRGTLLICTRLIHSVIQ